MNATPATVYALDCKGNLAIGPVESQYEVDGLTTYRVNGSYFQFIFTNPAAALYVAERPGHVVRTKKSTVNKLRKLVAR